MAFSVSTSETTPPPDAIGKAGFVGPIRPGNFGLALPLADLSWENLGGPAQSGLGERDPEVSSLTVPVLEALVQPSPGKTSSNSPLSSPIVDSTGKAATNDAADDVSTDTTAKAPAHESLPSGRREAIDKPLENTRPLPARGSHTSPTLSPQAEADSQPDLHPTTSGPKFLASDARPTASETKDLARAKNAPKSSADVALPAPSETLAGAPKTDSDTPHAKSTTATAAQLGDAPEARTPSTPGAPTRTDPKPPTAFVNEANEVDAKTPASTRKPETFETPSNPTTQSATAPQRSTTSDAAPKANRTDEPLFSDSTQRAPETQSPINDSGDSLMPLNEGHAPSGTPASRPLATTLTPPTPTSTFATPNLPGQIGAQPGFGSPLLTSAEKPRTAYRSGVGARSALTANSSGPLQRSGTSSADVAPASDALTGVTKLTRQTDTLPAATLADQPELADLPADKAAIAHDRSSADRTPASLDPNVSDSAGAEAGIHTDPLSETPFRPTPRDELRSDIFQPSGGAFKSNEAPSQIPTTLATGTPSGLQNLSDSAEEDGPRSKRVEARQQRSSDNRTQQETSASAQDRSTLQYSDDPDLEAANTASDPRKTTADTLLPTTPERPHAQHPTTREENTNAQRDPSDAKSTTGNSNTPAANDKPTAAPIIAPGLAPAPAHTSATPRKRKKRGFGFAPPADNKEPFIYAPIFSVNAKQWMHSPLPITLIVAAVALFLTWIWNLI